MAEIMILLALLVGVVILAGIIQSARSRSPLPAKPAAVDWDAAQDAELQAALAQGNKILAIRIYREQTGAGLKESKDAVEAILAGDLPAKKRRMQPALEGAAGVRDLLSEGRKTEAVELYARFAGVDQYTAQDAVEQIEREMRLEDAPPSETGLSAADTVELRDLLQRGQKIQAVKLYHDKTGRGLKESKDAVEVLEKQLKRG
jgi:ribosomal protein L7/L12